MVNLFRTGKHEGKSKVINIGKDNFTVSGHESDELDLLYSLEIELTNEINHGYIDGSFWSTVESLQIIESLDESKITIDKNTLFTIFDNAIIIKANNYSEIHFRNGFLRCQDVQSPDYDLILVYTK